MLWPTTDQMCVNVSRFCTYPLREKWVCGVVACVVRLGLSRAREATTSLTTSHEVGMQHQTRFVVGSNIKTHL